MSNAPSFSSRWGLMVAMLGMAVGTGNIWRFPRIAASNGGGEFLVAWVVFLLLWSVPLILVEFALGKRLRRGTLGTFSEMLGPRFAWVGAFIAMVAAAIGFYYAVVMGWTLRFLFGALMGQLTGRNEAGLHNAQATWEQLSFSPAAVGFQALALGLAVMVIAGGVRGIESAARVLMPALVVLVIVLAVRAVTLPGAALGLEFLFSPDWAGLLNYQVWVEALTQNAWDTGAGWGLVLTYAVYSRAREDTNLNAFLLASGNNSISLLAGIMVLCTVFSVMPNAASEIVGAGNEGLTFVWIPQLLEQIPGGAVFMVLFFLALVFAAWTSMVAMFELVLRVFEEMDIPRKRAILLVAPVVFLCGLPSAINETVFRNQDTVWSVALMLCGLSFAAIVLKVGPREFRAKYLNVGEQDLRIGAWWDWVMVLVALEAVGLFGWLLWQARSAPLFAALGESGWPGVGNMALQWGGVIALFLLLNRFMVRGLARYADKSSG